MFWEQHLIIRQNYNSEGTGATHLPLYFTHQTLNIHWKDRCWSSNTLATWFEEPAHSKRPWCRERSRARRRRQQKMRWSDCITDSAAMNLSKLQETVEDRTGDRACCSLWGCKESQTQWLNNNNLTVQSSRGTRSHRWSWAEGITVNWGHGAPGEDEEESQEKRWGH